MAFVLKFGWTTTSMEKIHPPSIDGIKIGREKVWSSNAKRNAAAKFSGTLIAEKVTLDMVFPADLTPEEIKKIKKYACPDDKRNKFGYIQFTNEENEAETKYFYFGNPTFEPHVYMNGKYLFSSIQVQAREV